MFLNKKRLKVSCFQVTNNISARIIFNALLSGHLFQKISLALRARIKFVKRVILMGFCTKKALQFLF